MHFELLSVIGLSPRRQGLGKMHGEMRSQYNVYVRVDIHKILQQDRERFRLGYLEQCKSELESNIIVSAGR